MNVIELSKIYVEKEYNNDFLEAINNTDGVLLINVSMNYINDNRTYCRYYDIDRNMFV